MTAQRGWVIDVCRTCDRLATWPFCPCRAAWIDAGMPNPPWCVPVVVRPAGRGARQGQPSTTLARPSTPPPGASGVSVRPGSA